MNIPEEQRQALLRFAEFQSKRLEAADDTTLMMTQLALYKLFERDPVRVGKIIAGALAIYGGPDEVRPPWEAILSDALRGKCATCGAELDGAGKCPAETSFAASESRLWERLADVVQDAAGREPDEAKRAEARRIADELRKLAGWT